MINQINNSKTILSQRPLFHFATPGGWCNDPNGFSQFEDKVHLFFQYHPYSTQWGPMHWGHAVSKDMLNWEIQPVALAPDSSADEEGCFSGTAIEHNGKHLIAYTGVSKKGNVNIQNQCIAAGDGITYKKYENNPLITGQSIPFDIKETDFRDPKIWEKDGSLYLLCVIKQQNECGAMVMFESKDDENSWNYKGVLDSSKDGLSRMWECPDIAVIDGNDVLIFSPQEVKSDEALGFHDGNNSVYVTGKLDYENCTFHRQLRPENGYTAAQIDYGIDFYAPETTRLSDGRIIMIAWMQAWESYITPGDYIWSGMMTLPRELSIKNNRLYQTPVRELENRKKDKLTGTVQSLEEVSVQKNSERHFEIDLKIAENSKGQIKLELGDSEQQVCLVLNLDEKTISFDRSKSHVPGAISYRKEKIRIPDAVENVKIICDTCSMEVFINDGIMTFTNAFFLQNTESELKLHNLTDEGVNYFYWRI